MRFIRFAGFASVRDYWMGKGGVAGHVGRRNGGVRGMGLVVAVVRAAVTETRRARGGGLGSDGRMASYVEKLMTLFPGPFSGFPDDPFFRMTLCPDPIGPVCLVPLGK